MGKAARKKITRWGFNEDIAGDWRGRARQDGRLTVTDRKSSPGARNIVVVGETFAASRTPQRVAAMRRLGHTVRTVPTMPPGVDYETAPSLATRLRYRLRVPGDPAGANAAILSAAGGADILWLETARMIRPSALCRLKALNPDTAIVCYSEDDMMNPTQSDGLAAAVDAAHRSLGHDKIIKHAPGGTRRAETSEHAFL